MTALLFDEDTKAGKSAKGASRLKATVASSTFCVPPGERMPPRTLSAEEPLLGSVRRSKVATTSSAPKGLPSLNLTPWRSLKVQTSAVLSLLQLSARTGRSVLSFSAQTKYSQTCWICTGPPASFMVTGSRAMSESGELILSVPPALGAGVALAMAAGERAVDPPPQAASSEPAAVAEKPKMEARTSS